MKKITIIVVSILSIFGISLLAYNGLTNPAGIDNEKYNRSLETFKMVQSAYEEDRPLTEEEEQKADNFVDYVYNQDYEENNNEKSEEEIEKQDKELKIQQDVIRMVESYREYTKDDSRDGQVFNEYYSEAKKSLKIN